MKTGMCWISTTIKKEYMDRILNGDKNCELKGDTVFWSKRLDKLIGKGNVAINFLCGQESYKFKVNSITKFEHPIIIDEVNYDGHYEILIGDRLNGIGRMKNEKKEDDVN